MDNKIVPKEKASRSLDTVFHKPKTIEPQKGAWIISLSKGSLGNELSDELSKRNVQTGCAGVALSGQLETIGLSACTGLCIWDKKHRAALLMQIPKEIGLFDAITTSNQAWNLDMALEHSLKFMYSKALNQDLRDIDIESLRPHIRENCTAMMFGGNLHELKSADANSVTRVGHKMLGFLDRFEMDIRVPETTIYYKEVNSFTVNAETGDVTYRLNGGAGGKSTMQ